MLKRYCMVCNKFLGTRESDNDADTHGHCVRCFAYALNNIYDERKKLGLDMSIIIDSDGDMLDLKPCRCGSIELRTGGSAGHVFILCEHCNSIEYYSMDCISASITWNRAAYDIENGYYDTEKE